MKKGQLETLTKVWIPALSNANTLILVTAVCSSAPFRTHLCTLA